MMLRPFERIAFNVQPGGNFVTWSRRAPLMPRSSNVESLPGSVSAMPWGARSKSNGIGERLTDVGAGVDALEALSKVTCPARRDPADA